MSKLSVKLKVTIWYTAVMMVISAIVLFAMSSITQDMITRDLETRLVRTVTDFSFRLNMPGDRFILPRGQSFYDEGIHMVIVDNEFQAVTDYIPFGLDDVTFEFKHDALRENVYNGHTYLEYDREIKHRNGPSYWIKGLASLTDESYAVKSAIKNNLLLTLILIILAGAGGYLIISRAFVPVNKIRLTAEEISKSSDLSRRIDLGEGKDEIHALADTFDEMLEKIENTLEREKQFTSDASHELRTPVAVIRSECEYLKTCAKTPEEYSESIDSINRQADKMQKLISELLTISRMDKNTVKVNFEETDISELLNFVCDEQEEIHSSQIKLVRNISESVVANVDKFLLARLFVNLISNAYQYSKDEGMVIVTLTDNDSDIIFTVKDDGIGISEENIPKIWERFYQVDGARESDDNTSMGLGLSMVKWIAECHGGSIEVESAIDEGSEFVFRFPAKEDK